MVMLTIANTLNGCMMCWTWRFLEEHIPHCINLKYVKEVHYGHDIKSRVETDGLITKHEIVTQGVVHAQARIEWKEK